MPVVMKRKLNGIRAAFFKGSFQHKENEKHKIDMEFWCFVGKTHSYFLRISGDHGLFKERGREIEMMKRSIQLTK
jgi:hypothetical protein